MNPLSQHKCEACRPDAPKVKEEAIPALLNHIPAWSLQSPEGINQLFRSYEFKDFKSAWDFTNEIAKMAEEEWHHPDILLEWGRVSITWWSHKIKGLHKNDFICAAKCDQIFTQVNASEHL